MLAAAGAAVKRCALRRISGVRRLALSAAKHRAMLTCYIGSHGAQRFSCGSAPRYLDELTHYFLSAKVANEGHAAAMESTHFEFPGGSSSFTGTGQ